MTADIIIQNKILPLFCHADAELAKKAVHACYDAGLRCFEYTNRVPEAPEVFYALKQYCTASLPGMLLGVGTIKNEADAGMFPTADFYVSPFITAPLLKLMGVKKQLWIPGCSTASEIALAVAAGIPLVKIFPANLLGGPAFIKAMKEIFPATKMLATGAMRADKAVLREWFDAGTDAVGIGSQLFGKNGIDALQVEATLKNLLQ